MRKEDSMETPLLDVLLAYDAWATRRLLVECCALSPEQFAQELGVGPGSLERTAAHLVGAALFFAARFSRRPPGLRPDRDGRSHTAAELLAQFDVAAPRLDVAVRDAVSRHAMTDVLQWTGTDVPDPSPDDLTTYGTALAQIVDHGAVHRTEAIVMLRRLGVTVPLEWHPFEWEEAARLIRPGV
jgi:uncharacterized damage-inducible protein DinB